MVKFIVPLFALAFLLVSCSKNEAPPPAPPPAPEVTAPVENPKLIQAKAAFDGTLLKGKVQAILHTSKGDITLELNADAAPKTVTNFVLLAKAGYYDNLTFHRVLPNFMIQGGDPDGNGSGGESIFGPEFEDEINPTVYGLGKKMVKDVVQGQKLPPEIAKLTVKQLYEQQGYTYNANLKSLPMKRGAIVMANRGPNTNGSQFFIVQTEETPWLEGRHTVFGQATAGLDVVDSIAMLERDPRDKPLSPVTFTVEVK